MTKILNPQAFNKAKEVYSEELKMVYADGRIRPLSKTTCKALESFLIIYLLNNKD